MFNSAILAAGDRSRSPPSFLAADTAVWCADDSPTRLAANAASSIPQAKHGPASCPSPRPSVRCITGPGASARISLCNEALTVSSLSWLPVPQALPNKLCAASADPLAPVLQPPPQVPAASLKGPLYTLASGMRAPPPMTISEGLLSQKPQEQHLNYSVAALMKQECDKMVGRRISARAAELEQMLQTKATCPGFLRVGHSVQVTHKQLALLTLRAQEGER